MFWIQAFIIIFQINCFSQTLKIPTKSFSDEISQGYIVYNIVSPEKYILPVLGNKTFKILSTNDKIFSVLYIKDSMSHKTTIIFDRNLNKNFKDDKAVVYDSDSLLPAFVKQNKNQIHFDSLLYIDKWYKFKYTLNKPSFLIFDDKIAESYFIMISNPDYYFGKIDDLDFNVYILNKYSPAPSGKNLKFVFIPALYDTVQKSNKIDKAQMIFKIGDTITLRHSTFILDNFDSKTNELNLIKITNKIYGYYKNQLLSDMDVKDIFGKLISTRNLQKGYLLIDFWGTWCGPCLANLPEFKYLVNSSKDFLQSLGVAYEKDEENLKKFVINNQISWPIIFDNENDVDGLKQKFNITKFPTYILVDSHHRILFRESGIDGLTIIANYLRNKKNK